MARRARPLFWIIAWSALDAAASPPTSAGAPALGSLEVEGFHLGMTYADVLSSCDSRAINHTQIYSMVDASGRELSTMPLKGARPPDANLLAIVGNPHVPLAVAPYVSAIFCNASAGSTEMHFTPPSAGNKVISVRFGTTQQLPLHLDDMVNSLVAKYGAFADRIGPFPLDPGGASPQPVVESVKWLVPSGGPDCAPRVRGFSEMEFTPLLSPSGRCATYVLARIVSRPEGSLYTLTLENLADATSQADRQADELRRTNPSLPPKQSAKAAATPSIENGCSALAQVGCIEATPEALCWARLIHRNRIRHINAASQPSEEAMLQCLMKAGTVEHVAACGVSCSPGPSATHASYGAKLGNSWSAVTIYGRACARMRQLGCTSAAAGACEDDLEANNRGRANVSCIEAAQVPSDVVLCGASCPTRQATAELLTESYAAACGKLASLGCQAGKSDKCPFKLLAAAQLLRVNVPSPRECLERAQTPIEVNLCGVPCERESPSTGRP